MKELIILRGVPGSGKSTFAKLICNQHVEADMFFQRSTGYEFDASRLKDAHEWCRDMVMMAMKRGESKIVVSNTFTQEWEMDAYYSLAKDFGYQVFSLIVENRHGSPSVHSVPEEKIKQMKDRFDIKL